MKLNLEFYKEREEEISEIEQEIIQNYIEKYEDIDYEKNFSNNITSDEVCLLSSAGQNILNWYPFEEQDTVLEIGGNLGEVTGAFIDKCKQIVTIEPNINKAKAISERYKTKENLEIIVGNLEQIKLKEKFDYIVLIGIIGKIEKIIGQKIELSQIIQLLEPYLKENGKFLIAVDNKFGLRYFVGNEDNVLNKKFQSMIGYNNEINKVETFTKSRLQNILNELGYNANFYYPLPDYKMPNVIFSDNQLPKYNSIDKYNPYFTQNATIIMNEIDVFREILKNDEDMFTFFANSFLVEVSKQKMPIKYKYISFNNIRKEEYRLITKIADEYVEKQVVNKLSNNHYNTIKENIKHLEKQNIKTLDKDINGIIRSKYIQQDLLLNNIITDLLEKNEKDKVENIIEKYIETLNYDSYHEEEYKNTIFAKYDIEIKIPDIIKELHFQRKGLWDMTFKNCFYIDEEFYFFDQEWVEENLPTEYILYRSILYTISLRRFINIEDWFEKYNLIKYKELFNALDNKLQEKIRDNRIWRFYSQNKKFNIDETKQELINMGIRSDAQQVAIENLKKEKDNIQKEYEQYRTIQEQRFTNKMRRKVKRIIGRK